MSLFFFFSPLYLIECCFILLHSLGHGCVFAWTVVTGRREAEPSSSNSNNSSCQWWRERPVGARVDRPLDQHRRPPLSDSRPTIRPSQTATIIHTISTSRPLPRIPRPRQPHRFGPTWQPGENRKKKKERKTWGQSSSTYPLPPPTLPPLW